MDILRYIRRNPDLKAFAKRVLQLRIRPNLLHRILHAEYTFRRIFFGELFRVFYWQPMFEVLCASVGEGCRVQTVPESRIPVVDNCDLHLGARVRLDGRSTFQGARNCPGGRARIEIGDDTYLGPRLSLRAGLGIKIGKRVLFAANVVVSGDPGHPIDPVRRRTEAAPVEDLRQITIGDDAWIAEGVTILGGVTIGEGAVIGARAVVTKDVPPRTVVAGNPARVIKQLDETPALKLA